MYFYKNKLAHRNKKSYNEYRKIKAKRYLLRSFMVNIILYLEVVFRILKVNQFFQVSLINIILLN